MKLKIKKRMQVFFMVLACFALQTCHSAPPVGGVAFTWVTSPASTKHSAALAEKATKMGSATCRMYTFLIAFGDCSLEAAMQDGKITKIHHVDQEYLVVLWWLFWSYELQVYGE